MIVESGQLQVDDVDETIDRLRAIGDQHGCTVQAIDADYVAGADHLEQALRFADRARERGEQIARSRAVELLLYVAATRQIDRAFELGLNTGANTVVVVIDAAPAAAESDEPAAAADVRSLLDPVPFETVAGDEATLQSWFDITEPELAATDATLGALVCERTALLVLDR